MDGVLHVASVLDVDGYLGALADFERRAGDGAVVGEHPHSGVPEALGDRRDAQLDLSPSDRSTSSGERACGSPATSVGK